MKLPKLKTRGIVCGATSTAVVTLLITGGFLPPGWENPEAVAALTGLIATLSAAFGACEWRSSSRSKSDDDWEPTP